MVVPLKYEIPESTRQCQIAVHSLVLDETARRFDTFALILQRGLMVSTEGYGPAIDTRHRSTVTCVSLQSFSIGQEFRQQSVSTLPK